MIKILKMCTQTAASKSSPRSCLLLKTLLFLLCIYIKRVTSLDEGSTIYFGATVDEGIETDYQMGYEGDLISDIRCPYELFAIKIKKGMTKSKVAEEWQKKVIEDVKVIWVKDDQPIHRKDGDPIIDEQIRMDKKSITLIKVSPSDEGQYTCWLDYRNISSKAHKYLDLYPYVTFLYRVLNKIDLKPDIKPNILHPPTDAIVRRGDNYTFTCKTLATLGHQTFYWFAGTCHTNLTLCDQFMKAYNKTKVSGTHAFLDDYILDEQTRDELQVNNINENNIGYYGCLVYNAHGYDIRLAQLKLIEVVLDAYINSTTTATVNIASNTTARSSSTITTNAPWSTSSSSNYTTSSQTNTTTQTPFSNLNVGASHEQPTLHTIYISFVFIILIVGSLVIFILIRRILFIRKDKKNVGSLILPEPIVGITCSAKERQHLPNGDCPDIYNIGKSSERFMTGLHSENNGHLLSQSIYSGVPYKENDPSISSTNSNTNSDEASSWAKSVSYQSDNNRTLYLHTSNTTTTTVPMYDHPPSTGTSRPCGTLVQDACVINPTYGLLRPETDATDWTFPRRNLERLNKIGEGQFGEVWLFRARQKDGNENYVAVKQLKERVGLGDRERLELIAEIEIMKLVNDHPNVIKILHYCADDYEPLLLIMEYAEHGKLQTYLRNCRSFRKSFNNLSTIITSRDLIKFSYHIAKGMEYVASKGIVHRDLASRNILVSKEKICKVADFGFARRVNDECAYERTTANPVPVKWMAPEALIENKFTSKSDVFSLGILMWEIVTLGATPYEDLTSNQVFKKVTSGERMTKPQHCKDEFYQIMASCWMHNPADRPSFKELAEQLEKLLLSENDYIELDQYPEHAYYNIVPEK